jgi:hypothetical protein
VDQRKAIGATGGAIGFGAFAAAVGACCAAPWAVGIFGVAGAVALARLSFLTPYLLTGAAALLLVAFWSAYRRPPVCDGSACDSISHKRLRLFVWAGAIIVLASAAWAAGAIDTPA